MTRILGVDPGVSGAWCVLDIDPDETHHLVLFDMPLIEARVSGRTKHRISEPLLAHYMRQEFPVDIAVIEEVHAMPAQGVSSMFTFGMSYGIVRGVLAALGVPFMTTRPQEWKKIMRVGRDKDASRQKALELYPDFTEGFARKRDHGRADAALMAWAIWKTKFLTTKS